MTSPLDHPYLTTMGLFAEAHSGLSQVLERRLETDAQMSVQWFEVLIRLARSPGQRLRMSELAAQTTLSPSGLTRAVDRLAAAGLVRREACLTDRRSAWACLTEDGEARLEKAVPVHVTQLTEILDSVFTPAEAATFSQLMRQLRDVINPDAARPPSDIEP